VPKDAGRYRLSGSGVTATSKLTRANNAARRIAGRRCGEGHMPSGRLRYDVKLIVPFGPTTNIDSIT
jgi:hypothetical protein